MTRTIIWSSPADPRDPRTTADVGETPPIDLEHRDDEPAAGGAVDDDGAEIVDRDDTDIDPDDDQGRAPEAVDSSYGLPHFPTLYEFVGVAMCLLAVIVVPTFLLVMSSHKSQHVVPKETSPPVVVATTPATTPRPARVVKPKRAKPVVVPTTVAAPVVQAPPPTQPLRTQTPVTEAPVARTAVTTPPATAPPVATPSTILTPYVPGISVPVQSTPTG